MVVLVVMRVTTPDHLVDHKWSIGVPRLSSYIWISNDVIFQGEHFGGGADRGASDHSRPRGRPQVVITLIQPNYGHIHTKNSKFRGEFNDVGCVEVPY